MHVRKSLLITWIVISLLVVGTIATVLIIKLSKNSNPNMYDGIEKQINNILEHKSWNKNVFSNDFVTKIQSFYKDYDPKKYDFDIAVKYEISKNNILNLGLLIGSKEQGSTTYIWKFFNSLYIDKVFTDLKLIAG